MHHVNTSSPSVLHVTRSSPSDPHKQSLTVSSPSDLHMHHVTTNVPCNYTCTTCPISIPSNPYVHQVSCKHTKPTTRPASNPHVHHVQPMTVISHTEEAHRAIRTCTMCHINIPSYQNVSYKQPARALRVLQAPQATHTFNACPKFTPINAHFHVSYKHRSGSYLHNASYKHSKRPAQAKSDCQFTQ